jgi:hypothetical protein
MHIQGFYKKFFSLTVSIVSGAAIPILMVGSVVTASSIQSCSSVSATNNTSSDVDTLEAFDNSESAGNSSDGFKAYRDFAADYQKSAFKKGYTITGINFDAQEIKPFYEIKSKYTKTSAIEDIITESLQIFKDHKGTPLGSALRFATKWLEHNKGRKKVLIFFTDAENEPLVKGESNPELENMTDEIIHEFITAIQKTPGTVVVFPYLSLTKSTEIQARFSGTDHLIIGTSENLGSNSSKEVIKSIKQAIKS